MALCSFAAVAACVSCAGVASGHLILNEYNAVKSGQFLDNNASDTRLGRVDENGGDWMEFVVTGDHADLRGWTINWSDGDNDSGTLTFTNNAAWSDVRAGTIITIAEDFAIEGEGNYNVTEGSDLSTNYIQNGGDWWMHITTRTTDNDPDSTYLTTDGGDGKFSVNNDDWALSIFDASNTLIFGAIGENEAGWGGGGLGKTEVGKLEANPSSSATNASFADGSSSTFGSPNIWGIADTVQDFSTLRAWAPLPTPATSTLLCIAMTAGLRRRNR